MVQVCYSIVICCKESRQSSSLQNVLSDKSIADIQMNKTFRSDSHTSKPNYLQKFSLIFSIFQLHHLHTVAWSEVERIACLVLTALPARRRIHSSCTIYCQLSILLPAFSYLRRHEKAHLATCTDTAIYPQ